MGEHEIEIEFSFVNCSRAINEAAISRVEQAKNLNSNEQSPIEFQIVPNTIKIAAGSQPAMLQVVGRLKNSY